MLLLVPLNLALKKPTVLFGMSSSSCCISEAVMFCAWPSQSFAILLVSSITGRSSLIFDTSWS